MSGPAVSQRRVAGVLLHPTSLPGRHGIGEIGLEAERWLERLAGMSQSLWQVLPLGPTGYGDSPYQTLSTFAGNPLMISCDALRDAGLVDDDRLRSLPLLPETHVDFGALIRPRVRLLHEVAAAFSRRAKLRPNRAARVFLFAARSVSRSRRLLTASSTLECSPICRPARIAATEKARVLR